MVVLTETIQIPIASITIKRGALGIIRVGPTDIEIPAEDVTITTASLTFNFSEEVHAIVTAEIAKLKESLAAAATTPGVAPETVVTWPKVKKD